MLRLLTCCLGLAGAAGAGAVAGPALLMDQAAASVGERSGVNRAAKADRLALPQAKARPATVTTVELVGLDAATVILRDAAGRVLFQADAVTNTTIMAPNVALPAITVKQSAGAPVTTRPAGRGGPDAAPEPRPARARPVGCESAVSALVNPRAAAGPGRCLVERDERPVRPVARPILADAGLAIR